MQIDSARYQSPNYDRDDHGQPVTHHPIGIVLHHGAGTRASDLATLCDPQSGVSAQYYVCRDGSVFQLVPDTYRAWHAGRCIYDGITDWNEAIGIETEHQTLAKLPQHTDWPPAQLAALAWLIRTKAIAYQIPVSRVVSHRQVAVPRGRKADPAHAPLAPESAFRAWVTSVFSPGPPRYTAGSPLLTKPGASAVQIIRAFPAGTDQYTAYDVDLIVRSYHVQAAALGLDPVLSIAQMAYETGALTSWWCARPRRNPVGLGVNGQTRPLTDPHPQPRELWHADEQRQRWRFGLAFRSWAAGAIPAHLGRVLAYVLPDGEGTPAQRRAIDRALALRPLPDTYRGCAQTLQGFEDTWATDSDPTTESFYADSLAVWANRLVEGAP